jgi:hypothetical protein
MSYTICLVGKAGSGKDSAVADYIVSKGYIKIALADAVKRLAMQIYGFSVDQLWGPSQLRNTPDIRFPRPDGSYLTPREALQKLGTDGVKNAYPDYWIQQVRKDIAALMLDEYTRYDPTRGTYRGRKKKFPKGFIIPDVRFADEYWAFKAADAKVLNVVGRATSLTDSELSSHVSETAQNHFLQEWIDYAIDNSGTIEETRKQVDEIIAKFDLI